MALVVLAALAASCQAQPAPEPSPSAPAGNALQPLATDLTWTYRSTTADPTDPNQVLGLVIAIVGSEPVGGETAWLLENNLGTTYASRLVAVERAGEVWVVAIDAIEDGAWKRTTLPAAQLYQPAPGARTWTTDYAAGPPVWQFTADWSQHASGEMTVLGRSGRSGSRRGRSTSTVAGPRPVRSIRSPRASGSSPSPTSSRVGANASTC